MTVSNLKVDVNDHGGIEHFVCICIATKICHDRGYDFKDSTWFKKRSYYPGEPDLYVIKYDKGWKDGKKIPIREEYVIEIEMNPTTESIEKKKLQFQDSTKGCELILIDMRKCDTNNIYAINKYLNEKIL